MCNQENETMSLKYGHKIVSPVREPKDPNGTRNLRLLLNLVLTSMVRIESSVKEHLKKISEQ